jgi:hypothetical protein
LTGTVPTELAKATALEYLILSGNLLKGTIPSELGQLKEMVYLGMDYNELSGTIPSSLSQLNNLSYFELDNNVLTGSVPEIFFLNKTYDNFNVYGNQLSDLIDVDEQAICSSISNSTGEEGEHYCNCGSDCLAESGQRCQCEKGQDCCDIYIEQNNITNCVVCEAESEFSNPDFLVAAWGYASCSDAAFYIYEALDAFGTEEQCNGGKIETNFQGCVCPVFVVPSKEEDDLQL